MDLEAYWKGFTIKWSIMGYKAVRDFDLYRIPTLFKTIEAAKDRIDKIIKK